MGIPRVRFYAINPDLLELIVLESVKLPSRHTIHSAVGSPFSENPFSRRAKRCFRFCVPEEWYRRSRTRTVTASASSAAQLEATVKQLAALEEFEEEGDDEGTAKRHELSRTQNKETATTTVASDWRASLSPNRLSTLFDGWIRAPPPTSPTRVSAIFLPDKKSVSEPKLLEQQAANSPVSTDVGQDDFDAADFEKMVVSTCQIFWMSLLLMNKSSTERPRAQRKAEGCNVRNVP